MSVTNGTTPRISTTVVERRHTFGSVSLQRMSDKTSTILRFDQQLHTLLNRGEAADIPETISTLLRTAREIGATDVHLTPRAHDGEIRVRLDGVLHHGAICPREVFPRLIARLKVLAQLLTYKTDVPQEGRISASDGEETRVSTFPTLFGEKAVVRLFAEAGRYEIPAQLGLPDAICTRLQHLVNETSGVILLTGPAGGGKTTTIYACLRELVNKTGGARSLVSLEDPIEVVVPGVAQSQVNASAALDLQSGLRSLLRQDPEVIMVGEIRDRSTAETVFQAALTGHLVMTTFHAGSAATAVGRLLDMGIEPYLLRSSVLAIVCQRLLRRLCKCAHDDTSDEARMGLGLNTNRVRVPASCDACRGTGYRGRVVLAEMLEPQGVTGRAILDRQETQLIEERAIACGMNSQRDEARKLVESGMTSPAEIYRTLGTLTGDRLVGQSVRQTN